MREDTVITKRRRNSFSEEVMNKSRDETGLVEFLTGAGAHKEGLQFYGYTTVCLSVHLILELILVFANNQ